MRAFPDAACALNRVRIRRWVTMAAMLSAALGTASAQSARDVHASLSAYDSAKVRGLLRTRLPCLGCHVVGDAGGRIGPDLTHVASHRSNAYIRAMVADPAHTNPGTIMPRIAMPSSTRELVIAYLSVNATPGDVPPVRTSLTPLPGMDVPNALTGRQLYARHCVACHGERGRGDGPNARYLPVRPATHADARQMSARSDDRLFDAIYAGGYPLGRSVMMPAFGETLTRAEIWLLVGHVRALCGCAGPAWSRHQGAAIAAPAHSTP